MQKLKTYEISGGLRCEYRELVLRSAATKKLLSQIREVKGFKNAKAKDLSIVRDNFGYKVMNVALKTKPRHYVAFPKKENKTIS